MRFVRLSVAALLGVLALASAGYASATATPAAAPSALSGLEAWINLRVIQRLTHHTSSVVAAVVLFWLVGFIVQRLLHDSMIKRCVLLFDEFVLLCLFVYFAYELFISL
jgi:uncharacterized membrane protein YGL010W